MQTFTTEQMGDFVEFWAKAKKSYGFNSTLNFEDVLKEISDLDYWQKNRVVDGLIFSAPTSASTQASGAVPAVWRVDKSTGLVLVDGLVNQDPGAISLNIDGEYGVALPALGVGQSIVATYLFVIFGNAEVWGSQIVLGTPATTASVLPPTNAEINAALIALGANDPHYIRIAKLTLNRTGDTTVTQSQDNTWRDV
jgi:hypothetical protein